MAFPGETCPLERRVLSESLTFTVNWKRQGFCAGFVRRIGIFRSVRKIVTSGYTGKQMEREAESAEDPREESDEASEEEFWEESGKEEGSPSPMQTAVLSKSTPPAVLLFALLLSFFMWPK